MATVATEVHGKACYCDECLEKNRRIVQELEAMIDSGNFRGADPISQQTLGEQLISSLPQETQRQLSESAAEQERSAKDGTFSPSMYEWEKAVRAAELVGEPIDAEYKRVPPVMLVSEMTHGRDRETIVLVWEVGQHNTAIDGLIAAAQRTGTMLTIPGMQAIVSDMATAEYRHKKRHGLLRS